MKNKYFLAKTLLIVIASQFAIESYHIRPGEFEWKQAILGAFLVAIGAIVSSYFVFYRIKMKNAFVQTILSIVLTLFVYTLHLGVASILQGRIDLMIFSTIFMTPFLLLNFILRDPLIFSLIFIAIWVSLFLINKSEKHTQALSLKEL